MSSDPQKIMIFLSSPGDVSPQRAIVREIIDSLKERFIFSVSTNIELIAWDNHDATPLLTATMTPQEAINKHLPLPSDCDIVVVLFWHRMGTPLDISAHGLKDDGEPYLSGTEWEFYDAVKAYQKNQNGFPLVYVFRCTDPYEPTNQDERLQYEKVEKFFKRFFDSETGAMKGFFHNYTNDIFSNIFEREIIKLITNAYESKTASKIGIQTLLWSGIPFLGLSPYKEEDAPIFFGREREKAILLQMLSAQRILIVVGASGSGKSSLVSAGLIPTLKANAKSQNKELLEIYARMQPSENPFRQLAEVLLEKEIIRDNANIIIKRLQSSKTSLSEILAEAFASTPNKEFFLFIDQFEQLFTITPTEIAEAFCQLIANPSQNLRIIITTRADFYHYLIKFFEDKLRTGTFTLYHPSVLALAKMIEQPVKLAGLAIEDKLVEQLLSDAGNSDGFLPLISYILEQLYLTDPKTELTFNKYKQLGGLRGVISKKVESIIGTSAKDIKPYLPELFLNLVEVSLDGIPTRKSASYAKVTKIKEVKAFVDDMIDSRLFVTHQKDSKLSTLELAHEVLFEAWPDLKDWIEKARPDLYLLRQMRKSAVDWEQNNRNFEYVWVSDRNLRMLSMLKTLKPILNKTEKDFSQPEVVHLINELKKPETTDQRRYEIGTRLAQLGDPRPGIDVKRGNIPDILWCKVTGGKYGALEFKEFYVAKYPVSVAQYHTFAPNAQSANSNKNYPQTRINWKEANEFIAWLNEKHLPKLLPQKTMKVEEWEIRLPNLDEWRWLATNHFTTKYPWKDEQNIPRGNTKESKVGQVVAVGLYPAGANADNIEDLLGNVFTWGDFSKDDRVRSEKTRLLLGESFNYPLIQDYQTTYPAQKIILERFDDVGIRLLLVPKQS